MYYQWWLSSSSQVKCVLLESLKTNSWTYTYTWKYPNALGTLSEVSRETTLSDRFTPVIEGFSPLSDTTHWGVFSVCYNHCRWIYYNTAPVIAKSTDRLPTTTWSTTITTENVVLIWHLTSFAILKFEPFIHNNKTMHTYQIVRWKWIDSIQFWQ